MIAIIGLLVLCVAAAISDIRKRIIPNLIVVMILLLGVIRILLVRDILFLADAGIRCMVVLLILYLIYMTGSMGAGDVKLYAALPLFYLKERLILIYFLIFIFAAVAVLIHTLSQSPKKSAIKQFFVYLKFLILNKQIVSAGLPQFETDRIPMAPPLAIGVLVSIIADNMGMIDFY